MIGLYIKIDVNNAFLHGCMDDDVYMLPPPDYTKVGNGEVCRLRKFYMV